MAAVQSAAPPAAGAPIPSKRKRPPPKGKKNKKKKLARSDQDDSVRRRRNKPSAKFLKLLRKRARDYNSDDDEEEDDRREERPPSRRRDDDDDGDEGLSHSEQEEEDDDDDGEEDEEGASSSGVTRFEEGCRAFRVAFLKIMGKKLPDDPLGPIMSAHKKLVAAKLAEEVEERKPKWEIRKEKQVEAEKGHVLPKDHLDSKEKELIKVAPYPSLGSRHARPHEMRPSSSSSSTARHRLMPPSYCICCRAVVPAAAAAYRRSAYRGATTSTGSGPGRLCRRSNPRHAAIPRKQQRGRHPAAPSALPEPQAAAAAAALLLVAGTVAAGTLVLRSSSSSSSSASSSGSSQQRREGLAAGGEAEAAGDGEECPDCGGTGLCGLCKGEGFVFKQLSEETATKARKAAKNMATRYTAGLPTKWTYCNKCSSTRSCTTCRGSGRIASTPSLL